MTAPNDPRRFHYQREVPPGQVSQDPAKNIPHAPPNFGRDLIPTIITFSGRSSSYNQVYRNPDQAVRESLQNARFMRNDTAIMECLESRMRAVALLNWDIEPENKKDPRQVQLAADMTDILKRTPYFTKYRYALMDAIWYGRYAMQHRYALAPIKGKQRFVIASTRPVNGDKLVFRWDDGSGKYQDGQVGIRVGYGLRQKDILAGGRKVEMTDQGMAYFLENWERPLLAIHRHITEDGAFEDPISAGRINGVGIRDRIYWCWFQKQETLAMLMEVIQRTGTGFTIYRYPAGNAHAKQEVREMAEQQTQSNIILMPSSPGDPTMDAYDLKRIEPSTGGIDALQKIIHQFFGHQIKRYILGQTLSSEAHPTGLGSGLANLHQDTFAGIVNFDAQNLAETLTTETLKPLKEFNFPWARDIPLYFRIHTQESDPRVQLAAFKAAWDMGAQIRGTDVLDAIGASIPQPGEEVLFNPQLVPKSDTSDAATTNMNPAGASSTQPQPPEDSPTRYQAGETGPWTEEEEEEHPRAPKGSSNGGQFVRKGEADAENEDGGAGEGSEDSLDERYRQGLRHDVSDYDSMTAAEKDAFLQGHAEGVRIGEETKRLNRMIETARKSQKQDNLSPQQRTNLQKEIDRWAAQIDALNAQRERHEKYVNKTPYKYHTTTEKLGIVAKKIATDPDKFIDAIVVAIKGKLEGITDPEQLREIAKGIAKKALKKLIPGVGAAQAAAELGAMVIELGGELYSFKLNLDEAKTERDLDDAADKLRSGLANVLVDKVWDSVVGKIKQQAGKAARKVADRIDGKQAAGAGKPEAANVGQPPVGAGNPPGPKAAQPPVGAGNPPGGKADDLQVGVGKGGGANANKPPNNPAPNAGNNPPAAANPPNHPPIAIGAGRKKSKKDPNWKSTQKGDTSKNSAILRDNLGLTEGDGKEAHHIVASTDERAAASRKLLDDYQIDINEKSNGIPLKSSQQEHQEKNENLRKHHGTGLHSDEGMRQVNKRLEGVIRDIPDWSDRQTALCAELTAIKNDIRRNRFP